MQYRNVLYMFEVYQAMVLRMIVQSPDILWNLPLVAASPVFQHANLFFYRGSQARSRIDKLKKFRGMTGYDTIRQDTTANAARTLDSRYQLGFNLL